MGNRGLKAISYWILSRIMRVLAPIFKTNAYAWYWRTRPVDVDFNLETEIKKPYRRWLAAEIHRFYPIESAFEFGCGAGQNLACLSSFGKIDLAGIDLNRERIQLGRAMLRRRNIDCSLEIGRDLKRFKPRQFDVSFSCAALMYIGEDSIREILSDLIRISRKGLLLVEFQDKTIVGSGSHCIRDGFLRNYDSLLRDMGYQSEITRLPDFFPTSRGWKKYGALIKVDLRR